MSKVPLRSEMKATNFPSGEIAGSVPAPWRLVKGVNCASESGFRTAARERSKAVQVAKPATSSTRAAISAAATCQDLRRPAGVTTGTAEEDMVDDDSSANSTSRADWKRAGGSFSRHCRTMRSNIGGTSRPIVIRSEEH